MDFLEFPYVLPYVKTTWIDKDKERFVACWADTIMHFWKYDIKLVCYWLFFYEPLLGSSNNGRYRDEYSRSALISEYSALYQVQEICSSTSHNTVGWVYISDIRELEQSHSNLTECPQIIPNSSCASYRDTPSTLTSISFASIILWGCSLIDPSLW